MTPAQRSARTRALNRQWAEETARFLRRSLAAQQGVRTRIARAKALTPAQRGARTRALNRQWETDTSAYLERQLERQQRSTKKKKKETPARAKAKPVAPLSAEFAVSADYTRRKGNKSVTVQIAMRAPANATKTELQAAVTYAINHDGHAPQGYDIAIVDWRGHEYAGGRIQNAGPANDPRAPWRSLGKPLALADVDISPIRKDEI